MILCTEFWVNFWPNFVSTILGLILGLPIAVWTNNFFNKKQLANTKKLEIERLKKALTVVKDTMIENKKKLEMTISLLNQNQIQFDTQLDSSAWDVVKYEIIQVLHNPKLQKRLAFHFSWLTSMTKSNKQYLDLNVGVNTTVTGMESAKAALKAHLIRYSTALITDLDEIVEMIDKELK